MGKVYPPGVWVHESNFLGKKRYCKTSSFLTASAYDWKSSLKFIIQALNLAELWGYRSNHSNPCLHIKKYKENKRERFLSQEKIGRLMIILSEEEMQNSSNPWPIHAIRLLLLTGCRLNEILTLKWEEIDLDNHCLRLRDSKTGKKLVYLSRAAIELFNAIPRAESNPFVVYCPCSTSSKDTGRESSKTSGVERRSLTLHPNTSAMAWKLTALGFLDFPLKIFRTAWVLRPAWFYRGPLIRY